jgi:hypothetical protein
MKFSDIMQRFISTKPNYIDTPTTSSQDLQLNYNWNIFYGNAFKLLLLLLLFLFTAIELSLGGSSPYTQTKQ